MIQNTFVMLFIISFLVFLVFWVIRSRNDKLLLIKRLGIVFLLFICVAAFERGIFASAHIPGLQKSSKNYVMDVNETKSQSGTHIRLKKVFVDLLKVEGTYSVWGKKKVVGIELKKSLGDVGTISTMTGLWCGGRILAQQESFGMCYTGSNFIDHLFVVFYLSDGNNINFEISDMMKVKEKVKVININKTFKIGSNKITFTKLYKAISYSSLDFEADFMPTNLQISITADNTVFKKSASWSGSGSDYSGGIWFDPIKSENIEIKLN